MRDDLHVHERFWTWVLHRYNPLRDCKGILFEVGKKSVPQFIRFRRAAKKRGYRCRILDMTYIQPSLRIGAYEEDEDEEEMFLAYTDCAWRRVADVPRVMSRAKVTQLLAFVYDNFCHAHYSFADMSLGFKEDDIREYHARLGSIKEDVCGRLEEEVALLESLPREKPPRHPTVAG